MITAWRHCSVRKARIACPNGCQCIQTCRMGMLRGDSSSGCGARVSFLFPRSCISVYPFSSTYGRRVPGKTSARNDDHFRLGSRRRNSPSATSMEIGIRASHHSEACWRVSRHSSWLHACAGRVYDPEKGLDIRARLVLTKFSPRWSMRWHRGLGV